MALTDNSVSTDQAYSVVAQRERERKQERGGGAAAVKEIKWTRLSGRGSVGAGEGGGRVSARERKLGTF